MTKRYLREFRDDVVRVARRGETPLKSVVHDFGISEATLYAWMNQAQVEDGLRPVQIESEATELRDLTRRSRLLDQEVEILRRATAYFTKCRAPK